MDESPADWIKSLLTRVAHVKVVVLCGGQFDRSRWREHVEFEAPHIPASVDCRHPKDCGGALQLRRLVEQAVEAGAPEQSCDVDCPGDTDGDGDVDISDLSLLLSQFGQSGTGLGGDVDFDDDVDISDLGLLLANFGTTCP